MTTHLSIEEARRLLTLYHFTPTDVPGVFGRLGAIQYDPLNPLGRNPDLVLQARVPGYRVDDWRRYAYEDRIAYDAWDKQACLVRTRDWARREAIRTIYHGWHDRAILQEHPDAVRATLTEIERRGPLSSLEFADRTRAPSGHTWYGPTIIKRILRALWLRGEVVTHHREGARHYYDLPERVIPAEYLRDDVLSRDEYHQWIILQRHIAVGLLRRSAETSIWSACGDAAVRTQAINDLCERGELEPVRVGSGAALFHMPAALQGLPQQTPAEPRLLFVAPLDSLLWDRRGIEHIFGFTYVWEVYKRAPDRQWGYYVLPVHYQNRFVARIDSRLEGKTWMIQQWWWEQDVHADADMLDALRAATREFLRYLRADEVRVAHSIDLRTRRALTVSPAN